jgi:hypothetical protein
MTVFHIGFPKSASTTLQKQLFDKHSQINFMGIYPTKNIGQDTDEKNIDTLYIQNKSLQEFHNCLTNLEGIEYQFSEVEKYFSEVKDLLSDAEINLFSNERFASVLFAHKDRAEKAKRIKQFFPDAKIIIIIRNQIDIIKSQYRDHPFDPRSLYSNQKSVTIDEWVKRDFKNYDISFVKSIEYYKLVKYYSELFGQENVGVFLFEELVQDIESFSSQISEFLNINEKETKKLLNSKHENDGVSQNLNNYRKFKSKVSGMVPQVLKQSKIVRNLDQILFKKLQKGKKQKVEMSDAIQQKVYKYYNEQNQLLAKEYNLELKKYGYINE